MSSLCKMIILQLIRAMEYISLQNVVEQKCQTIKLVRFSASCDLC